MLKTEDFLDDTFSSTFKALIEYLFVEFTHIKGFQASIWNLYVVCTLQNEIKKAQFIIIVNMI